MTTTHQLIADLVLFGITLAACTGAFFLLVARNRARRERDLLTARVAQLGELIRIQGTEIESLARFRQVRDAAELAARLRRAAQDLYEGANLKVQEIETAAEQSAAAVLEAAKREAAELRKRTNLDIRTKHERADAMLAEASEQASRIIAVAGRNAERIAGDAYRALQESDRLQAVAEAMRNVIEGYGDRYLKPTYGLLDELAEAYAFDDSGRELKAARERSRLMITWGQAATCEYAEPGRRDTAIRFVIDAFDGKVESILARVKTTNHGTLEQQIHDAFALVNQNGKAFRDARITPEYLQARLAELQWATAVEVKRQEEREEQRRIRERIREEQKAQREIDRALKVAARDEETIQKALAQVQAEAARASAEQRAAFDAQLAELQSRLAEADARNQRALSMAQQTKAGHVYVISNIGSFGEEVFKIGMTRRLEPLDRVRELGDASVPFAFDVHAMIWSEDAPALESLLHRQFVQSQVNKVNPRKEFFQVPLSALRQTIEAQGVQATWTMTAAAAEYRESQAITRQLTEDPRAAEEWLRRQAGYTPDLGLEIEEGDEVEVSVDREEAPA